MGTLQLMLFYLSGGWFEDPWDLASGGKKNQKKQSFRKQRASFYLLSAQGLLSGQEPASVFRQKLLGQDFQFFFFFFLIRFGLLVSSLSPTPMDERLA